MLRIMRSQLYSGSGFMKLFRQTIKPENVHRRLYCTLWKTGIKSTNSDNYKLTGVWNKYNISSMRYFSKECNNELATFLTEEIIAEENLQKSKTIPSKINDFEVKLDGSEVTLVKSAPEETITIYFNINHSLDHLNSEEDVGNAGDTGYQMSSKPDFKIDIERGGTTLGLSCSFTDEETNVDTDVDVFTVDEIMLYNGEWKDTNYQVSGSILDGYFYDLLMNYLDEKGISNEFVITLSELSTAYEHSSYISFLRDLQNYISK